MKCRAYVLNITQAEVHLRVVDVTQYCCILCCSPIIVLEVVGP